MEPFIGEIKMVGFNFAPRGYAFCNGAIMAISQNTALFSLLGTTFGGNGVSTFGLPDYRSRTPVGMGQGIGLSNIAQGEAAGQESTTLTLANLPSHTHQAVYSSAVVTSTGQISIPATTTQSQGSILPGNNTVLGPSDDPSAGAEVKIYSSAAANASLKPFDVTVIGNAPAVNIGMTGNNVAVDLRNPYLGTNFIIALEGIFPSRS